MMDSTATQALENDKPNAWPAGEELSFNDNVSPAMRELEEIIAHVAPTNFPLLLMGESGVGKEVVAALIHRRSRRNGKPFTRVVCGTLTPQLFDHLRSHFDSDDGPPAQGKIGTLFLDEITDLTPGCQASLLQAIPDGEVVSLGRFITARIISSTSKTPEELESLLDRGTVRRDLFYRLNGVCLRVPPLRERKEDIQGLAEFLLRKYALQLGCAQPALNARTLEILQEYSWPGNIRELENIAKRMVALGSDSAVAGLGAPGAAVRSADHRVGKFSLKQAARAASRQVEREMILEVLTQTHWNRKRAAQHLQISYKALLYKLRQMGLDESGTL